MKRPIFCFRFFRRLLQFLRDAFPVVSVYIPLLIEIAARFACLLSAVMIAWHFAWKLPDQSPANRHYYVEAILCITLFTLAIHGRTTRPGGRILDSVFTFWKKGGDDV